MSGRPSDTPDVARTLQVDEGDDLRSRALLAAAQVNHHPALVVVVGDDVGRRARVKGSSFSIGRSSRADFVLADPRISSIHVRIEDRGDGWALIDLGSTNGTRVNGEKLEKDAERVLFANDKIEIGDSVVRYELHDAADEHYEEHVQRMIDIDDLTGLYTRRRFDQEVEALLAAGTASVGMLVMDLDGLKAINDTHGHLFGAYVIGESGRLIGEALPDGGFGARFGGDEYVVALPNHDLDGACAIAEAIRAVVNEHPYEREGVRLRPGISIGCAVYPSHADAATALFHRADEALYQAKRGGKNRVCCAE